LGQVVSQRELISRRGEWKRTGKGVVCACGVFDLLHPGHIRLLEDAHGLGDLLIVAVQSDAMVRAASANRGSSRTAATDDGADKPITPAEERAEILAALSAVDFAVVTDDPPAEFLRQLQPDVFVCGDEPAGQATPASSDAFERSLAAIGCKLVRIPIEPGYSTSRLIERIIGRRA
jgi:rfaE bifunctional protein nucleotidyltransferase chain/domain